MPHRNPWSNLNASPGAVAIAANDKNKIAWAAFNHPGNKVEPTEQVIKELQDRAVQGKQGEAAAKASWAKQELVRFERGAFVKNSGYILVVSKEGKKLMSSSRIFAEGDGDNSHVECVLIRNLKAKMMASHSCNEKATRTPGHNGSFDISKDDHIYLYSYHSPCEKCAEYINTEFGEFLKRGAKISLIYTNWYPRSTEESINVLKAAGVTVSFYSSSGEKMDAPIKKTTPIAQSSSSTHQASSSTPKAEPSKPIAQPAQHRIWRVGRTFGNPNNTTQLPANDAITRFENIEASTHASSSDSERTAKRPSSSTELNPPIAKKPKLQESLQEDA